MRIAWNDESAQAISGSVNEMRRQMEMCIHHSRTVFNALEQANPDGDNKRLNAIEGRMEKAIEELRNMVDDVMEFEGDMKRMTMLFEEAERSARRLLNEMEVGSGAERPNSPSGVIPIVKRISVIPFPLPKPVIAPMPRINTFGPTPQWLGRLIMNHKANILLK